MGKTQRIIGAVLILLALGLAAYAWVLGERMTAEQKKAQVQLQPVVVAVTRIAAGTPITPEMIKLSGFPVRPEGSYGDPKQLLGRSSASDIAEGEPLLRERVETAPRTAQLRLEEGERAVAVRVDDVIAVGNRLSPGDQVDVYVTLRRNSEEVPDTQSRLLIENLRILAFGSRDAVVVREGGAAVKSAADNPRTAVLAVRLPDIGKLALAAESGRLLLALRPGESAGGARLVGTAGAVPAAKAVVAAASPAKVEPAAMTLRELLGARAAGPGPRVTVHGPGAAGAQGQVSVLHGLKERSVYYDAKQGGGRP